MSGARCWAIRAQPVTELRDCRAKRRSDDRVRRERDSSLTSAICCHRAPKPCQPRRDAHPRRASRQSRGAISIPLNFATNFAFFREADGLSTRLVTANYWVGLWRAGDVRCGCLSSTSTARALAEWREELRPGMGAIVIDSREVRARFGLPEFTGQLFLHVDRRRRPRRGEIRARHLAATTTEPDALVRRTTPMPGRPISMPGCRRPAPGETVTLWVQNSQPCAIPAGAIGLNLHGRRSRSARSTRAIAPFATCARRCRASCCPSRAGRSRSKCAPANISCGRATR